MYRLLSASKDTYITNKIVAKQESTTSNVGQAGTLDLFKLYNENILSGTVAPVEISRILIHFGYSELNADIVSKPSFTASLKLKDVYGGQTVPSNFSLVAYPLSKSFDEGRGFDVASYRDIDSANFITASTGVTWSASGASALGNAGADVDVIVSGDIGFGLQNFGVTQTFTRGDEDANFNITSLVSASVVGLLPNNGFRISFTPAQEQDVVTRFVKRFGAKQAQNPVLRPKIVAEWDDRIRDTSGRPRFGISQSFYTYNFLDGNPINFVSGGSDVTTLLFELAASRSVQYITSSFQANFSASINHVTNSVVFFSQSYTGSATSTGIYSASFNLDPTSNGELNTFLSGANSYDFKGTWTTLDRTTTYYTSYFAFSKLLGASSNAQAVNYVVNAVNLKNEYTVNDEARIRVFVQDRDLSQTAQRYAKPPVSVIIPDMRWRLVKSFSEEEVIPFSLNTRMSTDREGMYFDFSIKDLDLEEVYELEFLIKNQTGKDLVIQNKGFIFKVVS